MSKFEPERFINYETLAENVEVVKQRLGHVFLSLLETYRASLRP